tara:strand:+ start:3498 stop:8618 length:5121 start_codon:yes stop_codon:yes gene_type:complete
MSITLSSNIDSGVPGGTVYAVCFIQSKFTDVANVQSPDRASIIRYVVDNRGVENSGVVQLTSVSSGDLTHAGTGNELFTGVLEREAMDINSTTSSPIDFYLPFHYVYIVTQHGDFTNAFQVKYVEVNLPHRMISVPDEGTTLQLVGVPESYRSYSTSEKTITSIDVTLTKNSGFVHSMLHNYTEQEIIDTGLTSLSNYVNVLNGIVLNNYDDSPTENPVKFTIEADSLNVNNGFFIESDYVPTTRMDVNGDNYTLNIYDRVLEVLTNDKDNYVQWGSSALNTKLFTLVPNGVVSRVNLFYYKPLLGFGVRLDLTYSDGTTSTHTDNTPPEFNTRIIGGVMYDFGDFYTESFLEGSYITYGDPQNTSRLDATQNWSLTIGDWVTLDLGKVRTVSGVATIGGSGEYVTKINVETSIDGSEWTERLTNAPANQDDSTRVDLFFPQGNVDAQYVKITPLEFIGAPSMRVDTWAYEYPPTTVPEMSTQRMITVTDPDKYSYFSRKMGCKGIKEITLSYVQSSSSGWNSLIGVVLNSSSANNPLSEPYPYTIKPGSVNKKNGFAIINEDLLPDEFQNSIGNEETDEMVTGVLTSVDHPTNAYLLWGSFATETKLFTIVPTQKNEYHSTNYLVDFDKIHVFFSNKNMAFGVKFEVTYVDDTTDVYYNNSQVESKLSSNDTYPSYTIEDVYNQGYYVSYDETKKTTFEYVFELDQPYITTGIHIMGINKSRIYETSTIELVEISMDGLTWNQVNVLNKYITPNTYYPVNSFFTDGKMDTKFVRTRIVTHSDKDDLRVGVWVFQRPLLNVPEGSRSYSTDKKMTKIEVFLTENAPTLDLTTVEHQWLMDRRDELWTVYGGGRLVGDAIPSEPQYYHNFTLEEFYRLGTAHQYGYVRQYGDIGLYRGPDYDWFANGFSSVNHEAVRGWEGSVRGSYNYYNNLGYDYTWSSPYLDEYYQILDRLTKVRRILSCINRLNGIILNNKGDLPIHNQTTYTLENLNTSNIEFNGINVVPPNINEYLELENSNVSDGMLDIIFQNVLSLQTENSWIGWSHIDINQSLFTLIPSTPVDQIHLFFEQPHSAFGVRFEITLEDGSTLSHTNNSLASDTRIFTLYHPTNYTLSYIHLSYISYKLPHVYTLSSLQTDTYWSANVNDTITFNLEKQTNIKGVIITKDSSSDGYVTHVNVRYTNINDTWNSLVTNEELVYDTYDNAYIFFESNVIANYIEIKPTAIFGNVGGMRADVIEWNLTLQYPIPDTSILDYINYYSGYHVPNIKKTITEIKVSITNNSSFGFNVLNGLLLKDMSTKTFTHIGSYYGYSYNGSGENNVIDQDNPYKVVPYTIKPGSFVERNGVVFVHDDHTYTHDELKKNNTYAHTLWRINYLWTTLGGGSEDMTDYQLSMINSDTNYVNEYMGGAIGYVYSYEDAPSYTIYGKEYKTGDARGWKDSTSTGTGTYNSAARDEIITLLDFLESAIQTGTVDYSYLFDEWEDILLHTLSDYSSNSYVVWSKYSKDRSLFTIIPSGACNSVELMFRRPEFMFGIRMDFTYEDGSTSTWIDNTMTYTDSMWVSTSPSINPYSEGPVESIPFSSEIIKHEDSINNGSTIEYHPQSWKYVYEFYNTLKTYGISIIYKYGVTLQKVDISTDSINWTEVFTNVIINETDNLKTDLEFTKGPIDVKYVRIQLEGEYFGTYDTMNVRLLTYKPLVPENKFGYTTL